MKKYVPYFKASEEALFTMLEEDLVKSSYTEFVKGKGFLYAKGSLPVLLIAHVDTVHYKLPEHIFFDHTHQVMWSPAGLGADDRAGICGILEVLSRGYKPHVLFLDGEEKGGIGAKEAVKILMAPDVHYMIELDRKGSTDAVFYSCNVDKFIKYIESFGYVKSTGSFSDISILAPTWKICGVNLSIGYYNAHRDTEYLCVNEMRTTVRKVCAMLKNIPKTPFVYQEKVYRLPAAADDKRYWYNGKYMNLAEYNAAWAANQESYTGAWWKKDKEKTEPQTKKYTYAPQYVYIGMGVTDLMDMYGCTREEGVAWFAKHHEKVKQMGTDALTEVVDLIMFEELELMEEASVEEGGLEQDKQ